MFEDFKRIVSIALASALLAACAVIPDDGRPTEAGPAITENIPEVPVAEALPQDVERHRVALLVPLSGSNSEVGQSIANATTMALLDTGAQNLRITTYDTADGAGAAASRAISDGNRLILGPLMRDNVGAVLAQARPADVPLITFSNDTSVARNDVFVMGHIPEQSVARVATFAISQGARNFAALAPRGDYGDRALTALESVLDQAGTRLVAVERYDRGNTSVLSAADRLRQAGGYDTVMIADGARLSIMAADRLKDTGDDLPSLIGTELWSGEGDLVRTGVMRGAWFAAVPDARFRQFAQSYQERFEEQPFRIATLGYDAVLLTLRVTRDWEPGSKLTAEMLTDSEGFLGLDGTWRFRADGIGERQLEVRQIGNGTLTVVDPAQQGF